MKDLKDIFNEYETSEGIQFKLLSKNIHFPEDDQTLYEYMYVSENIPWTVLSYIIYGSINYWWVLTQLNMGYPFYAKKGTTVKYIPNNIIEEIMKHI